MKTLPIFTLLLTLAAVGVAQPPPELAALEIVERLFEAFNAHDPDAMAEVLAEDVAWLNVSGAGCVPQAAGREELREGMKGYFDSLPTVRSEIEEAVVNGRFVVVRERVSWDAGGERRSQASLAVYEVAAGRVSRVWYYPAVP